jgi:class 3 adenylate cyclase
MSGLGDANATETVGKAKELQQIIIREVSLRFAGSTVGLGGGQSIAQGIAVAAEIEVFGVNVRLAARMTSLWKGMEVSGL